MRILLVEDDDMIGSAVMTFLKQEGQAIDWSHDVEEARLGLVSESYDVILLDLGLPDGSGLDILTSQRRRGDRTPVVILTARDAVADRIAGLDLGADDYLIKPFDLDELSARIRAVHRRRHGRADSWLKRGQLALNPATHECLWQGTNVTLSAKEFTLIQQLLEQPSCVLSRSQLEETLYGWGEEIESNAVEVHIHNLRKKLARDVIRTIRGVGYILGQNL